MYETKLDPTQEFALSISMEYFPDMSETRRDFVKKFYRELIKTPAWIDYVIERALNDTLDLIPNREMGLLWFRKNISMLEDRYLKH